MAWDLGGYRPGPHTVTFNCTGIEQNQGPKTHAGLDLPAVTMPFSHLASVPASSGCTCHLRHLSSGILCRTQAAPGSCTWGAIAVWAAVLLQFGRCWGFPGEIPLATKMSREN